MSYWVRVAEKNSNLCYKMTIFPKFVPQGIKSHLGQSYYIWQIFFSIIDRSNHFTWIFFFFFVFVKVSNCVQGKNRLNFLRNARKICDGYNDKIQNLLTNIKFEKSRSWFHNNSAVEQSKIKGFFCLGRLKSTFNV